ncbi:heterokaryon incompatibility protein-domain-containing protein [Xylaria venustula]|nr:heterokaryon incompatibility protein-domain-containing protein [Xylaria venustula]
MFLIDTQSLDLEEFFGSAIPVYAILSHTWGSEEVSFQEWHNRGLLTVKTGYKKILAACQQAQEDGLKYLWVDTICIDKKSSAELSEAINSMFAFYANADRCYVHLVDFPQDSSDDNETTENAVSIGPARQDQLHCCRWFTRGWTLQELLAPETVIFFNSNWIKVGEKQDPEFRNQLSHITRVHARHLETRHEIFTASVSERMSWFAHRETTREEDIAYCMLGIFGINMPLLYGEGRRAFLRLQEEIIRVSNDQTIFCWSFPDPAEQELWDSVLAPHPYVFAKSGTYVPDLSGNTSYSLTNNGISIRLRGIAIVEDWMLAILAAYDDGHPLALILIADGRQHCRISHDRLRCISWAISNKKFPFISFRLKYRTESEWAQPTITGPLPRVESFLVLLPNNYVEFYVVKHKDYLMARRSMGTDNFTKTEHTLLQSTAMSARCLPLGSNQTNQAELLDVLIVRRGMIIEVLHNPGVSVQEIIDSLNKLGPLTGLPQYFGIIDSGNGDRFVLAGLVDPNLS